MITRITPERIITLAESQIFVFGSNLSGRHGKGAAKMALNWGAIYGQAEGLQGQTYAIPTKDRSVKHSLSIQEIKPFVNNFLDFARTNSSLQFLVTEIGCGLAGFTPLQIGPLFEEGVYFENIWLPERFWQVIQSK
ncbi:A1S_2505 family phage non-structural protein [Spirosoma koreense]